MGNKDVWCRKQSSVELASMASCPLHRYPIFHSHTAAELGVSLETYLSFNNAHLHVQQTAKCPVSV